MSPQGGGMSGPVPPQEPAKRPPGMPPKPADIPVPLGRRETEGRIERDAAIAAAAAAFADTCEALTGALEMWAMRQEARSAQPEEPPEQPWRCPACDARMQELATAPGEPAVYGCSRTHQAVIATAGDVEAEKRFNAAHPDRDVRRR